MCIYTLQQSQAAAAAPPPAITSLQTGRAYHWHDWDVIRSIDCVYIWNDFSVLELANDSNGWFRFVVNSRLATMYSSGSPEISPNPSENAAEFCHKVQRLCSRIHSGGTSPAAILPTPGPTQLKVGNWCIQSKKEEELTITNIDSSKVSSHTCTLFVSYTYNLQEVCRMCFLMPLNSTFLVSIFVMQNHQSLESIG